MAPTELCGNCGMELRGRYCSECGQENLGRDPSFRDFLGEFFHEFVKFDSKAIQTLKLLFGQPGDLTREFLAGRRTRYVSPLKFYLVCSATYFLAAQKTQVADSLISGAGRQLNQTGESKQILLDVLTESAKLFTDQMEHIFIVVVPFTALACWAVFRKRRQGFLPHFVFTLHSWSAIFIVMAILSVLEVPVPLFRLMLASAFLYQALAIRRVYECKWPETLVKSLALSSATLALVLVAFGGIAVKVGMDHRRQLEKAQADDEVHSNSPPPATGRTSK